MAIDYSKLRSLTVVQIAAALERDGFILTRKKSVTRFYKHSDGRKALLHWHSPKQELPIGTLQEVIRNEAK